MFELCKNYSLKVNVLAKKLSFSLLFFPSYYFFYIILGWVREWRRGRGDVMWEGMGRVRVKRLKVTAIAITNLESETI